MPRIRTVKPEFWTDSKVVALSPEARLLFIGAWNFADDYGCLPADAMQLKLRVLPAEAVDADELVEELLSANLLEVRETSRGVRFWHVTHWNRHQRVSHAKEGDYGLPDTWSNPSTSENPESSSDDASTREDSGGFTGEGKGREGNGTEGIHPLPTVEGNDEPLILDEDRSDPDTGLEVWVDSEGKVRRRIDGLWDKACEIWGKPKTKPEHGRRNKEISELRFARVHPEMLEPLMGKASTRWSNRPQLNGIVTNLGDLLEGVEVSPADVKRYQAEIRRMRRRQEIEEGP